MTMSGPESKLSDAFSTQQLLLSQAIQKNDQVSVGKLIACFPTIPTACILNLLQMAIEHSRLEIIRLLIDKGACVRSPLNCFKQNALHIAAMCRNKKVIMHILEFNADCHAVDIDDANVLHLALMGTRNKDDLNKTITSHHEQRMIIEILKVFINLGLDVNKRTKFGESPLALAVKSCMTDVAKFLIRSGADPYFHYRRGERIVHMLIRYVIRQNNKNSILTRNQVYSKAQILDFIRWLQSEGIKINIANKDRITPLQLAINHRLETMVPILMGLTDLNFVNLYGQSSLHIALIKYYDCKLDSNDKEDNSLIVNLVKKILTEGADVNVVDKSGNTPFHIAAKQKDHQLIQMMLQRFANINAQNQWGETVLHILISDSIDANGKFEKNYDRYIDILLCEGADVNLKNGKGMTPTQLAIQKKNAVILKVLVDHGADLNVRTEDGDDLFQLLIRSPVKVDEPEVYEDIIDVMINNGFGIDEPVEGGHTFLHQAALWGRLTLIKALLKKGADVNCKDNTLRRQTPLHIAIQYRSILVIEAFLNSGADVNILTEDGESPLVMAIKKSYLRLVKNLLNAGAEVNVATKDGDSPLMLAVRKGEIELIKLLLDHGADVHFCNEKLTPLHVAADTNQVDVVKLFVKAGVDVNIRNEFGETPLHLAACHRGVITNYLIESGAKIYLLDNKNNLPLHRAVERNNFVGLHCLMLAGQDINEVGPVQLTMFDEFGDENTEDKIRALYFLIKLQVIDMLVPKLGEGYMKYSDGNKRECMKEITKLKKTMIGQMSLYEFMHMSLKKRVVHVKNVQTEFFSDFPNYNFLIKLKVKEALERKDLLESAALAWYKIPAFALPELCLDIIFDYVNNDALKRFVKCVDSNNT